jgi:cytochrome c oxidase subunit 2
VKKPDRRLALRRVRQIASLVALALVLGACSGSGPQTSLEPAGPKADDINDLWLLVFWVAVAVFVIVEFGLVYAIWRFRERDGDERRPKQLHGNTALEITWTIIPAVLLAVITVPMLQGLFDLREEPAGSDVINVNVTGHQWWWEFEYVDVDGSKIVTANELHIPEATPVYLTMTSADVIHSFWVPRLNGKRDVVPGRITNLTLESDRIAAIVEAEGSADRQPDGSILVLGQCAEFCGLAHADMRVRVFVHTQTDYDAWVAAQLLPNESPTGGPAAAGWDLFNATCTACHQVTVGSAGDALVVGPPDQFLGEDGARYESLADCRGPRLNPRQTCVRSSLAPNLTHFASRTTFGGATFANDVDHLSRWIDNPSDLKPMDPDRNLIPSIEEQAEGAPVRILGMPDFGLDSDEIANIVALLQEWK